MPFSGVLIISGRTVPRVYGTDIVQLDHYVPWGWKDPAVAAAAKTLTYLVGNEKHRVIFEGAVTEEHIDRLCTAISLARSSPAVRVIQLTRSPAAAEKRRLDDRTLWPEWTEEQKRAGARSLETQVPPPIPSAIKIETDELTEDQVFAKVVEVFRTSRVLASKKPRDVTTKS